MMRGVFFLALLMASTVFAQAPAVKTPGTQPATKPAVSTPDISKLDPESLKILCRNLYVRADMLEKENAKLRKDLQELQKKVAGLQASSDSTSRALTEQPAAGPAGASTTTDEQPAYVGSSDGKTQHVSGYRRKDGTYVQPYNRRPAHR